MEEKLKHVTQVAKEIFNAYDTDKSGYIDKKELKPLLTKISKQL